MSANLVSARSLIICHIICLVLKEFYLIECWIRTGKGTTARAVGALPLLGEWKWQIKENYIWISNLISYNGLLVMVKSFCIIECKLCLKHCARHSRDVKMNKPYFQWAYRQVIFLKYHNRGAGNVLESTRENQFCGEDNVFTAPWKIEFFRERGKSISNLWK